MKIPDQCQAWVQTLIKGDPACGDRCECGQIVQNIQEEELEEKIEGQFFDRIAASLPPTGHQEARIQAQKAAQGDGGSQDLRYHGLTIPVDRFLSLARIIQAKTLQYVADEAWLTSVGLSLKDWDNIQFDELKDLFDFPPSGPFRLGKGNPVFVTESSPAVAELIETKPLTVAARLGIPWIVSDFQNGKPCVSLFYGRDEVDGKLHAPTVLDAVDHTAFRVSTDKRCGLTFAVDPEAGNAGLPEAIHRPCEIPNVNILILKS